MSRAIEAAAGSWGPQNQNLLGLGDLGTQGPNDAQEATWA